MIAQLIQIAKEKLATVDEAVDVEGFPTVPFGYSRTVFIWL